MADQLIRGYKYRLYPTNQQENTLREWQTTCHELHFFCVIQRRMAWRRYTKSVLNDLPSWVSQSREIKELRAEYEHYRSIPRDLLDVIVRRVEDAYQRMRKDRKAGKKAQVRWPRYPRDMGLEFRGNRGTEMVKRNERYGWWKLAGARSSLGELKVRMHRQLPDSAVTKKVHVSQEPDGWYISFACEIPQPIPLPLADKEVIGVDLGCIHEGNEQRIAVVSDGRIFVIPDELKRNTKRLATLQKLVSPKRSVNGSAKPASMDSNRTKRRRKKIAKLHQTIARQRRHHLDYIARMLCESADVIAFEDIDWRNLRAKGGSRKKGLNRSQSTAAPALLVRLTIERAELLGRQVIKVPAAYTSQDCSACGVRGESKDLSVREWQCEACCTVHDRDINAAKNIATHGREQLATQ